MRTRRPRLSWFRFYVDDFVGGTAALVAAEVGQYVLMLAHQWGTKGAQCVPDDPVRLRVICRGEDPSTAVLSKFVRISAGLRNERLASEWSHSATEAHAKGGGTTAADVAAEWRQNGGRCDGATAQNCHGNQKPDTRTIEETDNGLSAPPPSPSPGTKRNGAPKGTARERERLLAEPETLATSDDWIEAMGGERGLGLLRAAHRARLEAGYSRETCRQAIQAVADARAHPELYSERCSARWAAEHNRAPHYVLRPETLDKIAADYQEPSEREPPVAEEPPDPAAVETWALISSACHRLLGDVRWATWLAGAEGIRANNGSLVVRVASKDAVRWIRDNYSETIAEAVAQCGLTCSVEVVHATT